MDWTPHFDTDRWIQGHLTRLRAELPALDRLATHMSSQTGTRLIDWLDTLVLPPGEAPAAQLSAVQYVWSDELQCWHHPGGLFPRIVTTGAPAERTHLSSSHDRPVPAWVSAPRGVALKVESVDAFLAVHTPERYSPEALDPDALRAMTVVEVERQGGSAWWVVERHGFQGADPWQAPQIARSDWQRAQQLITARPRTGNPDDCFHEADRRIRTAQQLVGTGWTADLFFAAERTYWQLRNRAGQIQKSRQDQLGLGWANHDHHTFRCSRQHFGHVLGCLESLGMICRERFYAGAEAGWGAQVLEQPLSGSVVFADVDLSPDEIDWDFRNQPLPKRSEVGTVGLWCALHGESFLDAGLHHLECQFDYRAAVDQLTALGIPSLPPFTDLPYLKQGFTRPEMWPIAPHRLAAAREAGWIDAATADRFRTTGAAGSHLEILQRDGGFKGFNQHGISDIIQRTDPRTVDIQVGA